MFKTQLKTLTLAILCGSLFTGCGGKGGSGSPSIELNNKNTSTPPVQHNGNTGSQTPESDSGSADNADSTPPVDTDQSRYARRGRVIDGYVKGATVWLDLNSNAKKDEHEPFVISTDKGSYELELTEEQAQCAAYVPTYVDVPVGAIDEDLGEVTKAYQMVLPPSFTTPDDETLQHITPLTTVLWQSLYKSDEFKNTTCAEIIADNKLKKQLQIVLSKSIKQVVDHYNISEEQLFSDYIESGDESLKKLAENIVKGLQASVEKYLALAKEYLDAHEIRVLHYQDTPPAQPQSEERVWYRSIVIYAEDDAPIVNETVRMDENLEEVLFVHYDRKITTQPWGDGHNYRRYVDMEKNTLDDLGVCHHSEVLEIKIGDITYSLDNYKSVDRTSHEEMCNNKIDFSDAPYRGLSVSYSKNGVNYLTSITQDKNSKNDLPDWVNLADKPNLLDILVLTYYFVQSGHEFDKDITIPFYSWEKRITDDSSENRITTYKYSDGTWKRETYRDDGTYITHCSNDGEIWEDCEG
ncbi:hypothetical protein [Pseudoalteromonas luteoviolacea]|uniref:Lipoprotein n=1 Tax=Pseudoalteromonas luteoviolacea S4054 TaxID=1129367 RepID=A0A0F6A927_9GAMM|nr:hypothetical protein [Pseudoalteromonas luteoviolacea]AOT07840.1 hypothetical protein S4054249_08290 [Pseudoalteromonas luteoviolacea]AOT12756.1 hypothetical protein S40542_08290 [Pseudoalteromonas luteoviolacea]AOT17669.1 hypothetical protein S4054_08285 [Pseudoalteromonas luteoviolacea]KKE82331.1 hypothetical protein N479_19010 [Pseudoalteromonas luteoviolacea S4054]KZN78983.1 hypothetical protein N481_00640 [Pseudoalteromonas luteoviolacea S4047-1]